MKRILAFLGLTAVGIGGAVGLIWLIYWIGWWSQFAPDGFMLKQIGEPVKNFFPCFAVGCGNVVGLVLVVCSISVIYCLVSFMWYKAGKICERRK